MDPDTGGTHPVSVLAFENQPIMLAGLQAVFRRYPDLRLASSLQNIQDEALTGSQHDILLLGQPPGIRSILPTLAELGQRGLRVPIIMWVAGMSEMDVFRALQMGAKGILLRTRGEEALVSCIRAVHAGQVWLDPSLSSRQSPFRDNLRITPRERQIVQLVGQGLKNRDIAAAMSITPGTVKVHLMHIFEKTGIRDRFQLALQGQQILDAVHEAERARSASA